MRGVAHRLTAPIQTGKHADSAPVWTYPRSIVTTDWTDRISLTERLLLDSKARITTVVAARCGMDWRIWSD